MQIPLAQSPGTVHMWFDLPYLELLWTRRKKGPGLCSSKKLYERETSNPAHLCPTYEEQGLALPYHTPCAKQGCHAHHKLFCFPPQGTCISLPLWFYFSIVLLRLHHTLPCWRLDPMTLCAAERLSTKTCLDTGLWLGWRQGWPGNAVFGHSRHPV